MRRRMAWAPLAVLASVVALAGPASGGPPADPAGGAPGVTAHRIVTGAITTLSGPLAADFGGIVPGVRAYFDMVNAQGGVDGRKLDLAYSLDDGGNPSQFTSLVRDLVNQDHVFAVTGVGTDFFSPDYLAQTGTPTYGYNTTGGWADAPNFFGSDGSVQYYPALVPAIAYLLKRSGAHSVALLAYDVSASSNLCSTASRLLKAAGVRVSYQDLNAPIDGNMTPDVQRIQRAGSDFVMSCMDLTGNVSMARAISQYGVKATQLWFNGYDQKVIDSYASLMQGVYFFLPNVPLTAPTGKYPGLALYLKEMRRYQPAFADSALAIQGWASAALFVDGLRAAGPDLSQRRVVQLTNRLTSFNAGGLIAPVDWADGHSLPRQATSTTPVCSVYVRVEGRRLQPVLGSGHRVFVCLRLGAVRDPIPVPPPPGIPGAS